MERHVNRSDYIDQTIVCAIHRSRSIVVHSNSAGQGPVFIPIHQVQGMC